jgi:DNA-binding transcriptional MerR regulator
VIYDKFLTSSATAQLLSISTARLRDLERVGAIAPAARTSLGWRLFARSDVERLVAERARRGLAHRRAGARAEEREA